MQGLQNKLDTAYNIIQTVASRLPKDDCDLYAELLARKLTAFDESTRAVVMDEINSIVFCYKTNSNKQLTYCNSKFPIA